MLKCSTTSLVKTRDGYIHNGSPVIFKGRRGVAGFTPATFQETQHLGVALISSPSLLQIRRPQRRAATNLGLDGRRMRRESNPACQISSPAS